MQMSFVTFSKAILTEFIFNFAPALQ